MSTHAHPHTTGHTIRWAALYDLLVGALTLGREARLRESTLDLAGLAEGERVLDACCGTGTLAIAAARRVGPTGAVHGIDAAPEMIERARHKAERAGARVEFRNAPLESLPYPDASFDVVTISLALHHLPDELRPRCLAELRRVLVPGGRLLAVDVDRPESALDWLRPISLLHAASKYRLSHELPALERAGFADLEHGATGARGLGFVRGRAA